MNPSPRLPANIRVLEDGIEVVPEEEEDGEQMELLEIVEREDLKEEDNDSGTESVNGISTPMVWNRRVKLSEISIPPDLKIHQVLK